MIFRRFTDSSLAFQRLTVVFLSSLAFLQLSMPCRLSDFFLNLAKLLSFFVPPFLFLPTFFQVEIAAAAHRSSQPRHEQHVCPWKKFLFDFLMPKYALDKYRQFQMHLCPTGEYTHRVKLPPFQYFAILVPILRLHNRQIYQMDFISVLSHRMDVIRYNIVPLPL